MPAGGMKESLGVARSRCCGDCDGWGSCCGCGRKPKGILSLMGGIFCRLSMSRGTKPGRADADRLRERDAMTVDMMGRAWGCDLREKRKEGEKVFLREPIKDSVKWQ